MVWVIGSSESELSKTVLYLFLVLPIQHGVCFSIIIPLTVKNNSLHLEGDCNKIFPTYKISNNKTYKQAMFLKFLMRIKYSGSLVRFFLLVLWTWCPRYGEYLPAFWGTLDHSVQMVSGWKGKKKGYHMQLMSMGIGPWPCSQRNWTWNSFWRLFGYDFPEAVKFAIDDLVLIVLNWGNILCNSHRGSKKQISLQTSPPCGSILTSSTLGKLKQHSKLQIKRYRIQPWSSVIR